MRGIESDLNLERFVIPGRIFVNHVSVEAQAEERHQALCGCRTHDPDSPPARPVFRARQISGKEFVSLCIAQAAVDFLEGGTLGRCQALISLFSRLALDGRWIEEIGRASCRERV